jgi:hypothetical protein
MSKFDVIGVKPLEGYQVHLTFADGSAGVIDIAERVEFKGVFEALADPTYFRQVKVNPELGTICWDNGADLDPIVLYHIATGKPSPNFAQS